MYKNVKDTTVLISIVALDVKIAKILESRWATSYYQQVPKVKGSPFQLRGT